jgi:hypothetical protein
MRDTLAYQSVAAFTIVVSLISGLMAVFPPNRTAKMTTISTQPCQTFGGAGCEIVPEGAAWR